MAEIVEWGASGAADIPPGWWDAFIRKTEDFQQSNPKYGPAWLFTFGVLVDGEEIELTKPIGKPKTAGRVDKKSNLFSIFTALGGQPGQGKLELDSWIGRRLRVFVTTDESDPESWPKINKFAPAKSKRPPQPAPPPASDDDDDDGGDAEGDEY